MVLVLIALHKLGDDDPFPQGLLFLAIGFQGEELEDVRRTHAEDYQFKLVVELLEHVIYEGPGILAHSLVDLDVVVGLCVK